MEINNEGPRKPIYYISIIATVHLILSVLLLLFVIVLAVTDASGGDWFDIPGMILLPWFGPMPMYDSSPILWYVIPPIWSIVFAIAAYYMSLLFYRIARSIFRK